MSIISDALKKAEGNSSIPSMRRQVPPIERVDAPRHAASPPVFSVWSIVLSTLMVVMAAVLLLATWMTHRKAAPAVSSPVAAAIAPLTVEQSSPRADAVPDGTVAAVPATPPTDASPTPTLSRNSDPGVSRAAPRPVGSVSLAVPTAVSAPVAMEPSGAAPKKATPPASSSRKVVGQGDELVLTGTISTPRTRMARINGKIVREGAEIAGYRVVAIARDTVRLSKDEKFYLLRLKR